MKTKRKQSSVDVSLKIRYILGTKNRRRGKKKDVLSTGKCDYSGLSGGKTAAGVCGECEEADLLRLGAAAGG